MAPLHLINRPLQIMAYYLLTVLEQDGGVEVQRLVKDLFRSRVRRLVGSGGGEPLYAGVDRKRGCHTCRSRVGGATLVYAGDQAANAFDPRMAWPLPTFFFFSYF